MRIVSWMCLTMLCCLSKTISAQVYIDIFNAGHTINLESNYKAIDKMYNQQTSWLNVNIPIVFNAKGDFIMPSLQYSHISIDSGMEEDNSLSSHNFDIGASWLKNWSPYWASHLTMSSRINSDFSLDREEQIGLDATLLLYFGKKEELVWNFGINYSSGIFDDFLVPLIGVDWMFSEKFTLSFQTFSHLQLDYHLAPKIYTGIVAYSTPYSFIFANSSNKSNLLHTYSEDLPFTPHTVGLYTDVYLSQELVLFGKVGYEFSKSIYHEFENRETVTNSPYSGTVKSTVIVEVGVAWRKRNARKYNYIK